MAQSGLYARLCHAFLVINVFSVLLVFYLLLWFILDLNF